MPVITPSTYTLPNRLWRNAHVQTALPSLIKRIVPAFYKRQRLETPDGDFLDVDWSRSLSKKSKRLAIICHGLEGSSRAPYVKGMGRAFRKNAWDVAQMNFRSCSGEANRLARSYHSGETDDLAFVLDNITEGYDEFTLVGFSLGGNVVLKYLGEQGHNVSEKLRGAVAFSVPCDLAGSCDVLAEPHNKLYMKRFLRMLKNKVAIKHRRGDWISSPDSMKNMTSFWEFDDAFTAPLHGFKSAKDYYQKSSSIQYLTNITVPTLLLNAKNDPFLSPLCFPIEEANASESLFLEAPLEGGHCGFPTGSLMGIQWHEERAIEFLNGYFP